MFINKPQNNSFIEGWEYNFVLKGFIESGRWYPCICLTTYNDAYYCAMNYFT